MLVNRMPHAALGAGVAMLAVCAYFFSTVAMAITVEDDQKNPVTLAKPAKRIVSLAPHLTEILFEIGVGERIVGTIEYSDYPSAASRIDRIGSGHALNLEAILAKQPDLVLAWRSGSPAGQVERLRQLGLTVFYSDVQRVSDLPALFSKLGALTGVTAKADVKAVDFRRRYEALKQKYVDRRRVRVFYQLLDESLMTLNGKHIVSDILRDCGGENVFHSLPILASRVSLEALLATNPDALVVGGLEDFWKEWPRRWQALQTLSAVKAGRVYYIPADVLHRSGPRILNGAERVCDALEAARSSLP
jgi:iron complex transport system substrate-binding protein